MEISETPTINQETLRKPLNIMNFVKKLLKK